MSRQSSSGMMSQEHMVRDQSFTITRSPGHARSSNAERPRYSKSNDTYTQSDIFHGYCLLLGKEQPTSIDLLLGLVR